MKKTALGACAVVALVLGNGQTAEATTFVRISANGASASCDNGILGRFSSCSAGFVTFANSNVITFNGSIGGYNITNLTIVANAPGAGGAFVNISLASIKNVSGVGGLFVEFGAYDFSSPPGPVLFLSASHTANWTLSSAQSEADFAGYARADNLPLIPGNSTAIAPTLASLQPATDAAAAITPDVAFMRLATPYALAGRHIIHQAIGTVASYQGAVALTN